MAYERNRVLTFGAAGVVIAALLILMFIPARTDIGISPAVSMTMIPGYGFQIVKMSEEQADIVHLNITLDGFEVRKAGGDWAEVSAGVVSFDINRVREVSFTADVGGLEAGSYSAIRFRLIHGLEFANATLSSGLVIDVDVPSWKVEFTTQVFEVAGGTESLLINLRIGSVVLSNYMMPQLHLALGTLKVEIDIAPT